MLSTFTAHGWDTGRLRVSSGMESLQVIASQSSYQKAFPLAVTSSWIETDSSS